MTGDRWHVTGDRWHVTCDTWYMTHDKWLIVWDEHFQKKIAPYLLWFGIESGWKIFGLKDDSVTNSDWGDCRIALATPGLLNTWSQTVLAIFSAYKAPMGVTLLCRKLWWQADLCLFIRCGEISWVSFGLFCSNSIHSLPPLGNFQIIWRKHFDKNCSKSPYIFVVKWLIWGLDSKQMEWVCKYSTQHTKIRSQNNTFHLQMWTLLHGPIVIFQRTAI